MHWSDQAGKVLQPPYPIDTHVNAIMNTVVILNSYGQQFVQLWSTINLIFPYNQVFYYAKNNSIKWKWSLITWYCIYNCILSHSETTVKCKTRRCNIMLMGPLLFSVLLLIKHWLHMQSWICCWLFKLGMKMRPRFLYIWMGKQCLLFGN